MTNGGVSHEQDASTLPLLRMYGGTWVGLVPLGIFVAVMVWLSIAGRASTDAFWAAGWLAIAGGLLLARDRRHYAEAIIRGLRDRTGIVIVVAFVLAGVFGQLLNAGGLVDGLLWLGREIGVEGTAFVLLTFAMAMVFSVGVGTSLGAVVALAPVFYPVGVFLGADPAMVAVALVAGGAFGDNLAPISDTTIVSAFTQEADMGQVVRSRLPLSVTAAAIAAVALVVVGFFRDGGEVADASRVTFEVEPIGLLMFVPIAVVVAIALTGRTIVESLVGGSLVAIAVGVATGQMTFGTVFHVPEKSGDSTGVIQDGIAGVTGAVIFVLLILGVARVLIETGVTERMLAWMQHRVANTVRQAELTMIASSILMSVPLSTNASAMLVVGPTIVKPLGARFGLSPARKANLMDCAVCTVFYVLPWHNIVLGWYAAVVAAAAPYDLPTPPITAALANPYSWALLAVLLVSAVTGWNRRYAEPAT